MSLDYLQPSFDKIHPDWQNFLDKFCADQLIELNQRLAELATKHTIYPQPHQILRALELYPPQLIKVVILGQDPYHGENQANGLSFALNSGSKITPSLRNIYKQLANEYQSRTDIANFPVNLLESWHNQGVMLLNSSLNVIKDQANSLANIGWENITDKIIYHISEQSPNCVFMLWGNFARTKRKLINEQLHLVLEAAHPSPLSAYRGFFGCNHFSQANQFLIKQNIKPINWL